MKYAKKKPVIKNRKRAEVLLRKWKKLCW